MSDKPEHRRGAIDTLVVRDRTAVFWFLVACAVGTACGIYTMLLAEALQKRPPFVVMDTAGAFYVPDGVTYGDAMNSRMHEEMGNILAETLLARTPTGLVYQDRLQKLLWLDSRNKFPIEKQIDDELDREAQHFKSQQVNQTVMIEKTVVLVSNPTQARTLTTGTVNRTKTFSGQQKVERFRFKLDVNWRQNDKISDNKGFPSQVLQIGKLTLEPITEL
jgi:hypothetical protein